MPNSRRIIFIFLLIIIIGFAGLIIFSTSVSDESSGGSAINFQPVKAVTVPDRMSFAGERVPLEIYYVREHLDRELTVNTYWHSSTILMLKQASRWFPVIEPILKEHGIPEDFKYLALIESGLMQVVSPSGAAGFWQFLKGTAKDYGLEVSRDVDERYHIVKSTEAACRYLLDSHERFGNWTLVAASYNAGQNRLEELVEVQKAASYYDLYLTSETSRYIYRILAVKEIYQDPGKYGFFLTKDDLYDPVKTRLVKVTDDIDDLAQFARDQHISYRTLKELNPWLKNTRLKVGRGKIYEIAIPVEKSLINR